MSLNSPTSHEAIVRELADNTEKLLSAPFCHTLAMQSYRQLLYHNIQHYKHEVTCFGAQTEEQRAFNPKHAILWAAILDDFALQNHRRRMITH